jgi:hypothetical protein
MHLRRVFVALPIIIALYTATIITIVSVISRDAFSNNTHIPTISLLGGVRPSYYLYSYGLISIGCMMFFVVTIRFFIIHEISGKLSSASPATRAINFLFLLTGLIATTALGLSSSVNVYEEGEPHNYISVTFFLGVLVNYLFAVVIDIQFRYVANRDLDAVNLIGETQSNVHVPRWLIVIRVLLWLIMFFIIAALIACFLLSKALHDHAIGFLNAMALLEYTYVFFMLTFFVTFSEEFNLFKFQLQISKNK